MLKIFSVKFEVNQALIEAETCAEALNYSFREWGRSRGPYNVTEATEDDIAWVKGMAGMVHQA